MHVSLPRIRTCAGAALVIAAFACGERAPTSIDEDAGGSRVALTAHNDIIIVALTRPVLDTVISVFAIDPATTATYQIAAHRLWVRAGGVCALNSTYGPTHWDDPCDPSTTPILVTAKSWYDSDNRPHVDFSPRLRFAPLSGKRDAAELYLKDRSGLLDPAASILYCGDDGVCIDESLTDSSLSTSRDRQQGFFYRRIKHFSGYEVGVGGEIPPDDGSSQR